MYVQQEWQWITKQDKSEKVVEKDSYRGEKKKD